MNMDDPIAAVRDHGVGHYAASKLEELFQGIPGRKLTIKDVNQKVVRIVAGTWGDYQEPELSYCYDVRNHEKGGYYTLKEVKPDGGLVLADYFRNIVLDPSYNVDVWLPVKEAIAALKERKRLPAGYTR